jgi:hypothetical protein
MSLCPGRQTRISEARAELVDQSTGVCRSNSIPPHRQNAEVYFTIQNISIRHPEFSRRISSRWIFRFGYPIGGGRAEPTEKPTEKNNLYAYGAVF